MARGRLRSNALSLEEIEEEGLTFKTGVPVRIPFVRNVTSSKQAGGFGSTYQQDIEPVGRYLQLRSRALSEQPMPGWQYGEVTFASPLVLRFNTGGGPSTYDNTSWKAQLRDHYGAKGKALSRKIVTDGYDAIITVTGEGARAATAEIVDLTGMANLNPGGNRIRDLAARVANGG